MVVADLVEDGGVEVADGDGGLDLAVEGGILKNPIDISAFADTSFATKITEQ